MIPGDVVLVTNYQTVSRLGLVNTYLGMMVVFLVSAMNIFIMRQNFLTFSKEIKEASEVDGCGNFRFFATILLPLNKPVITTVFISAFMGTWNTYLWPMMVTNQNELRTIQVGVTMLNFPEGTVYTNYGCINSGITSNRSDICNIQKTDRWWSDGWSC